MQCYSMLLKNKQRVLEKEISQWEHAKQVSFVFEQIESSINLLRGKIYEAMDNRTLAVECYREAVRQDVYCYEAFDLLVKHHMLSAQEGSVGISV